MPSPDRVGVSSGAVDRDSISGFVTPRATETRPARVHGETPTFQWDGGMTGRCGLSPFPISYYLVLLLPRF